MFALLTENGPCTIQGDLSTKLNPFSWNTTNVIWLDQPTGVGYSFGSPADKDFNETNVGFSFGSPADTDYNETNVGENIYWFLQEFLNKHPQYQNRELFLTGESYGGHYVPAAAHYIWKKNQENPVINLQEQMKDDSVECIELTRECLIPPKNETFCLLGVDCWDTKLVQPLSKANRNNYDIHFPVIMEFLNSPKVRKFLNVDKRAPAWVEENEVIRTRFIADGDWASSYDAYAAELLNDGLRVLIYAGDADLMCNWIGNRAWTLELDWRGKDGYFTAEK
ncbi:serine protease family S10, putative [Phytophthora infestans T30-4]|uniref:Carboxypeptidase n=1 Tax=Phytophthora infestans (strain T30-4) TaxID=403677 RepID=D0P4L4_PHYIT|nr:serine protease family S10, putative [Phytophthora infestans T30-4]EEY67047.1 serine protease family S10, putative [Phytophthora infestans T30-4]|eukprot:XP_002894759.1 serine protease family S10, putative [Phytophthora infestans T30-4]